MRFFFRVQDSESSEEEEEDEDYRINMADNSDFDSVVEVVKPAPYITLTDKEQPNVPASNSYVPPAGKSNGERLQRRRYQEL